MIPPRGTPREGNDRRSEPRNDHGRDRRIDLLARKRVAQMSPEEMKRTLLTHELTGIKNRRAYEESPMLPVQAAIDADSLKWFNDTMGHEAGDRVLRAIALALDESTPYAYHIAGDEFLVQGATEEEVRYAILYARRLLKQVTIEAAAPDGTVFRKTGLEISYGIGTGREASEAALARAKKWRETSGVRAARGEAPRAGLLRMPAAANDAADAALEGRPLLRKLPWLRLWSKS